MDKTKHKEPQRPQCIIHKAGTDNDDHLLMPQSYDSWITLLEAARVRKHEPILEIAKNVTEREVPEIYYHRKCRSIFTMKRDLQTLKRKADESTSDITGSSSCTQKKSTRKSSSDARVYEPMCIFCHKIKYLKRSSTREKIVQALELRADKTLRECAIKKGDKEMIALTCRDIVAAEAHYHVSCYKNFTRRNTEGTENVNQDDEVAADEFEMYHRIERLAYAKLFQFIRTEIIPNKTIVPVTSLTAKLVEYMFSYGITCLKHSTRKHIHRSLESEFGNSVDIFLDDNGKLLLVPNNITIKDVVLQNQSLQRELKVWKGKSSDINKIIDQTSLKIRSAIKQDKTPTPWPYHPNDIKESAHIAIPSELERFLLGLLTGDPDSKTQSYRITTLIQSFSQDMIYAVTGGQHKPPKHILLPYGIKTLTGNIEIIRTLNKLGHGVSYSQLEENDTALCLQKLAMHFNHDVILPASINPGIFTNLAWDNIDRLEETLTGKGTSHRVNGIAVQPKIYGPHLPRPALPLIEKQKQRTINIVQQELEPYISGARVGPHPISTLKNVTPEAKKAAQVSRNKNLVWTLARQSSLDNQTMPSWTGFNMRTRDQVPTTEDVVAYLPTINAPATELTTVFEILKQSEEIRHHLSLKTLVVVMDQALYAKAVEIAWKHKDRFSSILLRMGTFHTIMNFLSILGKRFRDSGLRDICIEAGLVAEGSINGVLDGKQYNRAVRTHKCIYEALMRLAWIEFTQWVDNIPHKTTVIRSVISEVSSMTEDLNQQALNNILQSPLFTELIRLWTEFLEHLRHNNGELSEYWMSYIDMVEDVLLGLLRASREGNWDLHISAIETMIPWCFAYDKVNYARYLSAYLAEMTNLPQKNPDVYRAFKDGHFAVQLSSSNPFGKLPVDQTIEVTVNKDTQTPGGTIKFSLKAGAIKRYYITAEYRSAFLRLLREMTEGTESRLHHADLQQPRIQKDEEAVSSVTSLIQGWINPFSEKRDIVSISTAKTAPKEVASDLLRACVIGEQSYATFKEERLEKDPPVKKFHDPIKANKLKTFTDMCKKKAVNSSGKEIILKADRSLYGRIIVMAQVRDLQMQDVLCHPLGPLPWALATPDGLLRKTNKASLATNIQKNVTVAEKVPEYCASVIDGMNLVQRVKGDEVTFGDIANTILSMALNEGKSSDRIDVVFDTYQENSIKNSERSLRGEDSGHQLQSITSKQIVRQWRHFLTRVSNKNSLISFIVDEWKKPEYRERLEKKILYVTVNDKCYRIVSQDSELAPELECHQEEADGRLLFHAAHAAREGYQAVVICSEDTDVFIMSLAFQDKIGVPIFQKCGTKARKRLVDIRKVASTLGINVCRALVGMHSYTGCDTTSAFAGKGKASALKLLTNNEEVTDVFLELGEEWDLTPQLLDKLEAFTCLLYAPKASFTSVNNLRYNLFCAKKGEIESHQLPPCRDCLVKHAERANYQAAIWKRCLENDPQVPNPVGRGWKIETIEGVEQLVVDWMDGQPAPQAILDLLACKCTRSCVLPNCDCLANGLKCTDMCRLQDCENKPSISEDDDISQEDVEEDEDELENNYDF